MHITIVGGGPAGLATALALRQYGFEVLVVEMTTYTNLRIGEYLSAEAKSLLNSLRVPWEKWTSSWISSPTLISSWGNDTRLAKDTIYNAYGDALLLSREIFDYYFAKTVASTGVDVLTEARLVDWRLDENRWFVKINHKGATKLHRTDMLVDASGRSAYVATRLGTRLSYYDRMIALIGLFAPGPESYPPLVEIEACAYGWWYSAVLRDETLVVNHFTEPDGLKRPIRGAFLPLLSESEHTRMRVEKHGELRDVRVRSACSQRLDRCVGPGWIAVGDAAMSYDPLSAAGLMKAIQTGIMAAKAIRTREYASYQSWIDTEFDKYLKERVDYYRMENRWPESAFWRRNKVLACV